MSFLRTFPSLHQELTILGLTPWIERGLMGLDYATRHPLPDEESERKATVKRLLRRMQAANETPMVPLTREEIYER